MINPPADFRVPCSNNATDFGLLEAERRLLALEAWANAPDTGDIDRETADLDAELEVFIAETPAHTMLGLAVKLRALRRLEQEGFSACDWSRPCVETALAAIVYWAV